MKYTLYEVGGRIRDYYLGVDSKDVDYSVVFEEPSAFSSPLNAFYVLRDELLMQGFEVFKEDPDVYTIRAMFPKDHQHSGVADFVIARKELHYKKGTREPVVELGTLMDDLERRDFTVNAMARAEDGTIIDPFGGQRDLVDRILRTPSDAFKSFNNDPLRLVRALRFSITKKLGMSDQVIDAIKMFNPDNMVVVSEERLRDEMYKMFYHNTKESMRLMMWLYSVNAELHNVLLGGETWLMPTNKK